MVWGEGEVAVCEPQARLAAPSHAGTPTETGLGRPHEGHGLTEGHSVPWPSAQPLLEGGEAILAQDHSPQQAWELQAAGRRLGVERLINSIDNRADCFKVLFYN